MRSAAIETGEHLQKVRHFHDEDAPRYRVERYRADTCEGMAYITRKEIILSMMDTRPGKVLDVGCGPGILTGDLLARGHRVYSADISLEMIEEARRAASHRGSNGGEAGFVVSDASRICFSADRMDMVLSIGLMCYVRDQGAVLSEIYRVLKPGGSTILQINNIRWPRIYRMFVPFYHYLKGRITGRDYRSLDFEFNLPSRKRFLKELADSRFDVLHVEHYDFRVPFLDILLPRLSVRLGRFMFRRRHLWFCRFFAHGLLIRAGKRAAGGA